MVLAIPRGRDPRESREGRCPSPIPGFQGRPGKTARYIRQNRRLPGPAVRRGIRVPRRGSPSSGGQAPVKYTSGTEAWIVDRVSNARTGIWSSLLDLLSRSSDPPSRLSAHPCASGSHSLAAALRFKYGLCPFGVGSRLSCALFARGVISQRPPNRNVRAAKGRPDVPNGR